MRDTLPGETVRVRPLTKRGDGFAADIDALLTASPERVAPPCPNFPTCGGCSLQQWDNAPYQAWKSTLLDAALRSAGYVPTLAPLRHTPPHARRRMDFAIRRERRAVRLGLHRARGGEIVDLHDCTVLHPALVALLAPLRAVLAGLGGLHRAGSVVANLLNGRPDLLLRLDGDLSTADRTRLAAFAAAHGIPRIAWARGDGPPEIACQSHAPTVTLGGVAVTPPPGVFLQASADGEAALVEAVLAGLPGKLTAKARVADLYAGCGTFSFALAARARVVAYEGDAAAVAALRGAMNAAVLTGRMEAHHRDLVRQPLRAKELATFAAVVLDPPHAGASTQTAEIAASKVAGVIYVSCNPAALARDARMLRDAGYTLVSATPIDQFLWSARLESVAVFSR